MSAAWAGLSAELARWRDQGRIVEFWLRDDDAVQPNAALDRLFSLADRWQVPLALAVVPQAAQAPLFACLPQRIDVLQHGFDHRNRAPENEKRSEFPPGEPGEAAEARLCAGRTRLAELAGTRTLDVLVPPWNRIAAPLLPRLAGWGFRGLSRFGARTPQPSAGVRQVNTHVDLIAWKGGRGFIGLELALRQAVRHLAARRDATIDPDEPTGWLTHHACHDAAVWSFLEDLFARVAQEPGVRWRSARDLFASARR